MGHAFLNLITFSFNYWYAHQSISKQILMIRKILYTATLALLTCYTVIAQKDTTMLPAAFKQLIGCWQGTLNYSGTIIRKPYTTTATLIVKQIGRSCQFEFLHIYTQNPNDKSADTLTISTDSSKLNNARVTSMHSTPEGNIIIITEAPGFEHDYNKAAIIRQTYTIGKQHYNYKKEIQPEGQTEWLESAEFTYVRTGCAGRG